MVNKIFFTQAWDCGKKLGRYYNEFLSLLPEDSWACLMDGDTMFLDKLYGKDLYEYIKLFPQATLTCRTNRLHISNTNQQLKGIDRDNHDIMYHWKIAEERKKHLYQVSEVEQTSRELMGGMLMLVSKKTWREAGYFREDGILDVDNHFHRALIKKQKQVLVMEGIYIYHRYRHDGSKQHLL